MDLNNELQYADKPPQGFNLIDFESPAKEGDIAFHNYPGEWKQVMPGQNIIGGSASNLWHNNIMSVARRIQ